MAQNPYLDPNAQEILGLQRQQKLADLLSQRGMEMPEQQMVSGRVVPINPLQSLVPMLNAYQGRKMSENVEQKGQQLANMLRGQNSQEAEDIISKMSNDPKAALMAAINGRGQFSQTVAPQLMSNMFKEETPTVIPEGGTMVNRQGKVIAQGKGKTQIVGNDLVQDGQVIYKGERKPLEVSDDTKTTYFDATTMKPILVVPKTKVFAPQASQMLETPEGYVQVNPNTGAIKPINLPSGQPLMGNKPLTESQGNATAYGMRMMDSNNLINNLENKGTKYSQSYLGNVVGGTLGTTPVIGGKLSSATESAFNQLPELLGGTSEQSQQYQQAKRNFITAVLRKESGAVIGDNEMVTEDKKYFPQRGDPESVIKQKQNARNLAIKAMGIQAGPQGAREINKLTNTDTGSDIRSQADAILRGK